MRYVFFCSLQFMYICARHQYKCNRQKKRELNLRAKRALFFKCKIAIGILFDFLFIVVPSFFLCSFLCFFNLTSSKESCVCMGKEPPTKSVWNFNFSSFLLPFGRFFLFYFLLFAFLSMWCYFQCAAPTAAKLQTWIRVSFWFFFAMFCGKFVTQKKLGIYVCTRTVLVFIFKCSN